MVPERMFTIRFYIKCVAQIKLVLVKNVDFASKEAGFSAIHSGAEPQSAWEGHVPPHFYKWLVTKGTVGQTRN